MRIGHGYDVHRFKQGRALVIGGVQIPFELGLDGHSDADVLIHAVCDALLGAAGLGDIGLHFPDTSEKYKGIDSTLLLKEVCGLLNEKGYAVGNVDCTIIAQKPKFRPFIDDMRARLAECVSVDVDCVNVKATTEEGLGFTGAMQGIAAHSVCIIFKK